MELQLNGSIQTGDDGRARLDLTSGTIIRVAPASLFTFTSNQPSNGSLSTQINLNLGGLFIILSGGNANVIRPRGSLVRGSYLSVYVGPIHTNRGGHLPGRSLLGRQQRRKRGFWKRPGSYLVLLHGRPMQCAQYRADDARRFPEMAG